SAYSRGSLPAPALNRSTCGSTRIQASTTVRVLATTAPRKRGSSCLRKRRGPLASAQHTARLVDRQETPFGCPWLPETRALLAPPSPTRARAVLFALPRPAPSRGL